MIPENVIVKINDLSILDNPDNKNTQIINTLRENFDKVTVYDDAMARDLVVLFGDEILTICYDELLPAAYKCDIFRLVALYMFGGVYVDAGIEIIRFDRLKELMSNNEIVFTKERPGYCVSHNGIVNGFMCTVKEHPFIKSTIEHVKTNVRHFKYGANPLAITGPGAVGDNYTAFFGKNCEIGQQFTNVYIMRLSGDATVFDGVIKITKPKIRDDIGEAEYKGHYHDLWGSRKVFFHVVNCKWNRFARNCFIDNDGFLNAKLKNDRGKFVVSKIKYDKNKKYSIVNGCFCILKT